MKYLMFMCDKQYMPVIFPEHVSHSQVRLEVNPSGELGKPLSGGFFHITLGKVYVHSMESCSSLDGLLPKPEDVVFLQGWFDNMSTMFFVKNDPCGMRGKRMRKFAGIPERKSKD